MIEADRFTAGLVVVPSRGSGHQALLRVDASLANAMSADELRMKTLDVVELLRRNPAVEWAHPNYYVYAHREPDDLRYNDQWHYFESGGGINLPAAWDSQTGSSDVIVAVVDSGIVPQGHEDLHGSSNLLTGYDMVDRDDDPTDVPGNWHGTHVAGTIGVGLDRQRARGRGGQLGRDDPVGPIPGSTFVAIRRLLFPDWRCSLAPRVCGTSAQGQRQTPGLRWLAVKYLRSSCDDLHQLVRPSWPRSSRSRAWY